MGGTTFGALSSIGSDLSVSVSFNIARELLDAAEDEQISEDELIGLVLGFAIVFTSLQAQLGSMLSHRKKASVERARVEAHAKLAEWRSRLSRNVDLGVGAVATARAELGWIDAFSDEFVEAAAAAAGARLEDRRTILDFLYLVISICQRISVAISVQLLAASVRAQQPSRLVRTVSLIGLATFFVFVESLTHRTLS